MTELSECLCLDLSDTLTSDIELLANFLESTRSSVLKTETEFDNLLFSGGESTKNITKLLTKE
jgi:hypothetical protein